MLATALLFWPFDAGRRPARARVAGVVDGPDAGGPGRPAVRDDLGDLSPAAVRVLASRAGEDPYPLFAASNAGSLAGLLAYPLRAGTDAVPPRAGARLAGRGGRAARAAGGDGGSHWRAGVRLPHPAERDRGGCAAALGRRLQVAGPRRRPVRAAALGVVPHSNLQAGLVSTPAEPLPLAFDFTRRSRPTCTPISIDGVMAERYPVPTSGRASGGDAVDIARQLQSGQTTTEWLMVAGVLTSVALLFLNLFPSAAARIREGGRYALRTVGAMTVRRPAEPAGPDVHRDGDDPGRHDGDHHFPDIHRGAWLLRSGVRALSSTCSCTSARIESSAQTEEKGRIQCVRSERFETGSFSTRSRR